MSCLQKLTWCLNKCSELDTCSAWWIDGTDCVTSIYIVTPGVNSGSFLIYSKRNRNLILSSTATSSESCNYRVVTKIFLGIWNYNNWSTSFCLASLGTGCWALFELPEERDITHLMIMNRNWPGGLMKTAFIEMY